MKKVTKLKSKTNWKLDGQTISIDKIEVNCFNLTGNISQIDYNSLCNVVKNVALLSNADFYKSGKEIIAQITEVNKKTLIKYQWKMSAMMYDQIVRNIHVFGKDTIPEYKFYIR